MQDDGDAGGSIGFNDDLSECGPFRVCFGRDCWDYGSNQHGRSFAGSSWVLVFVLGSVGVACLAVAELGLRFDWVYLPFIRIWNFRRHHRQQCRTPKKNNTAFKEKDQNEEEDDDCDPTDSVNANEDDNIFNEDQLDNDLARAFVKTQRTETNFCRNNADPGLVLPLPYEPEYEPVFPQSVVMPVTGFLLVNTLEQVFSPQACTIVLGSLGWALLCSSVSTVIVLAIRYEEACGARGFSDPDSIYFWVESMATASGKMLADYRFFPIFLIVGYIAFVVERWREWFANCHVMQGRLHDIAILLGACVGPNPSFPVRKRLFKIYRYLNALQALCYKSALPSLCELAIETDFVKQLKLFTLDEAYAVLAAGGTPRELVFTWLAAECQFLYKMEGVTPNHVGLEVTSALRELRAACANHHGALRPAVSEVVVRAVLY